MKRTHPPDLAARRAWVDWERRHLGVLAHDTHEPGIVAHLFKLYADKMKWRG